MKNSCRMLLKSVALGTLFCLSNQAFAVCDRERRERDEFKGHFDDASKATIATFGTSLIPCAAASGTADNQKRIFNEKEANLQNCELANLHAAEAAAREASTRLARIRAINTAYQIKRDQKVRDFQDKSDTLQGEYLHSGFDLSNPDIQEEIRLEQKALQDELNSQIQELEFERSREVARV